MASIPEPENPTNAPEPGGRDLPRYVYGLAGGSEAENRMHVEARAALLNRLVTNAEVDALLARWTGETRLGRAAAEAGRIGERLDRAAVAIGYRCWADIDGLMEEGDSVDVEVQVETEEAGAALQRSLDVLHVEAERVADELEAAFAACRPEFERLHTEAVAFVRDRWTFSWPWIAYHLVECWARRTADTAAGERTRHLFWLASPMEMHTPPFATRPGEMLGEAIARLASETLAGCDGIPKGRKTDAKIVDRYVDYWYRKNVDGESIRSIAGGDDNRSLVRYGIEQAHRWLDAATFGWKDEADG